MRLFVIVLTVLVVIGACGRDLPEGVVQPQAMKALLLDMHLADGQLASMQVDSARVYRDAYYEAIFDRYAIDSTTFKQSIDFYASRPEMLKAFYVDIEKQLEAYSAAEQKKVEEKYAAERRADSIMNARLTDSLRRVERDSLDFKRKRYLLYLERPDSVQYGVPIPVTYMLLKERLMEAVGLPDVSELDLPGTASPTTPTVPPAPTSTSTPPVEERASPTSTPPKKIN